MLHMRRGQLNASHMASTVFFCPRLWAPDILSPYRPPIALPAANCAIHAKRDAKAKRIITGIIDAGSLSMKLTEFPTTMINASAQM